MTTLVVSLNGKDQNVLYTQNLRFTDFMKVNNLQISDVKLASDLFNGAKRVWTNTVMVHTKNTMVEKAGTKAVFNKKEGWKFRRTVTYQKQQATGSIDEIEAVKSALQKNVDRSLAYQSAAQEFLADYDEKKPEQKKAA